MSDDIPLVATVLATPYKEFILFYFILFIYFLIKILTWYDLMLINIFLLLFE